MGQLNLQSYTVWSLYKEIFDVMSRLPTDSVGITQWHKWYKV